jgi:hypothetical protein
MTATTPDPKPLSQCATSGECVMDEACPFYGAHAKALSALVEKSLWHSETAGCGPDAKILTCKLCIQLKPAEVKEN